MENITDEKIRLTDQNIEYKKAFRWHSLPVSEIIQAYLRIEEVKSTLCCGNTNFDMHFLMLKKADGTLLKTEVSSKEIAKQFLDELKARKADIEIGYKKEGAAGNP